MKRAIVLFVCVFLVAWSACSREKPVSERDTSALPAAASSAASDNLRVSDRFPTAKGPLAVTPLEHASVLLGWDGKAIYVDPTSPAVEHDELPKADVVFVTEARFDHFDAVAVARLTRPGTLVVGPPAVAQKTHVDVVMNDGDTREVDGIVATAVPLYSVLRGPGPGMLYHERGRGHGYLLDLGGTRLYLSGDTECTPEVMALRGVDVAFVAVGPPVAMTTAEAARCVEAFRPRVLFPYHDRHVDLSDLEQTLAGRVEVRARNFAPRAERWRVDAVRACAEGQIGICRDRLELARYLDPESEQDPRVIRAREQVRAWQSPFPPWW